MHPLPARRPRDGSHGVSRPYGTYQRGGSGSPGDSSPRHLPPSGFELPSRRLPLLRAWRRPVDRHSAHGVRPSGSCTSPPAVPLSRSRLSCRSSSPPEGGWSRLQRLAPAGKGPDSPPPEGGDGRTLPSWDCAPPRLSPPTTFGPASRSCSLLACCWGCSLRTTPSPDCRGSSVAEAAWSLSRLPAFLGFGTSSNGGLLRATCAPGLWLRLGLRTLVSGGLLGAPDYPTGVQPRVVSVRRISPDTQHRLLVRDHAAVLPTAVPTGLKQCRGPFRTRERSAQVIHNLSTAAARPPMSARARRRRFSTKK